jgi:WD repeat-containing protein 48
MDWEMGRSLAPSVMSTRSQDEGDEGDGGGETLHGIPYAHLVRLTSPNDPFPVRTGSGRERDAEVATLYSAASVVSVPPLRSPLHTASSYALMSPLRSAPLPNSRAAYVGRDMAANAVPLVTAPDTVGTIAGERGLVRALVLNDRVHAISVDTGGEVGVWDLVRGLCVGVFLKEELGWEQGDGDGGWSPRDVLEHVRGRIEGEAVVGQWATADTKSGVLAVHLNERSFESEIYADEMGYAGDRRFGDEAKCMSHLFIPVLGYLSTLCSEPGEVGSAQSLSGIHPRRTAIPTCAPG